MNPAPAGERPDRDADTLRRELEEAQSLARLGSWRWTVADNRVTWSNELYRIYGLDPSGFGASFEAYLERVHDEDRERVQRTIGALLDGGGTFDFVERIVRPDGEVRWLRSRGHAVVEQGAVSRLVGTCQDITEQKEAEAREHRLLEESIARKQAELARESLHRVFQQAPAAIAVLRGPELRFETVNPLFSELIGGMPVLGRSLAELTEEGADDTFARLIQGVYASGERHVGHEVPARRRHPDGSETPAHFDFVYEPLRDARGETDGVMIHAVDVTEKIAARTELTALAERLQKSNEELEQFAYVASHDLRAPLRGISNLAQWIEEDAGEQLPETSREHLGLLRGRVERLDRLIDGILQYSRAARRRFERESIDLGELVDEIADLLGVPDALRRFEGAPRRVTTERVPLEQVLRNLVSNAVRHGGEESPVVVSVRPLDGAIELSVTDQGPGIDPRFHDRIFGIFQTLKPRDELEGSGVGLSIVRKLVESRGGAVAVESAPGEGATFRVTWPIEGDSP